MSKEILVDGTTFTYDNTRAGIALLVQARIAAARRLFGSK
jgi:hypothetical protein